MRRCWLFVVLAACGTDVMELPGAGSGSDGSPPPMANAVSGHITADTTWSGIVNLTGPTTIDAGVTVTVAPGTIIETSTATVGVTISGTLDIEGASGDVVHAQPAAPSTRWAGFDVASGGTLIAHYLVQVGGGIHLSGSSQATIVDSEMSRMTGDFLTMSNGSLDVSYSSIGLDVRADDTTHCDMHFTGGAINVTHTNVSTAAYGVMFYGGQGADFTYDNWFANSIDVDTEQGVPVTGDFSFGWFQRGTAPTGTGIVAKSLASGRLADAGPRP
jgi:hypothetical protein